jgi:hypothetical protein
VLRVRVLGQVGRGALSNANQSRRGDSGGRLWVPQWCQCVGGQRRSRGANTTIPNSAQAGNAVLDAAPETEDQVTENVAKRPDAAMVACFLDCLRP